MKQRILTLALGVGISVLAAQAHHSISGVYDTGKEVTIEAVVAQFHFVNPHPFVTVDVANNSGRAQAWRLEMDNLSELTEVGMTSQSLKAGDRVTVTGNPGRNNPQTLYIRRLDRLADGFRYEQVGSSPRISTTR